VQENTYNFQFDQLKEIKNDESIPFLYGEAQNYICSYKWCKNVLRCWYDENSSILDKLGLFLFEIDPTNKDVDKYIWIIVGDLPSVYLDASIETGKEALETYCILMEEWADNVLQGHSLEECYPVKAEPIIVNAESLKSRVAFIRKELLGMNI
jgi:hypothetical protein